MERFKSSRSNDPTEQLIANNEHTQVMHAYNMTVKRFFKNSGLIFRLIYLIIKLELCENEWCENLDNIPRVLHRHKKRPKQMTGSNRGRSRARTRSTQTRQEFCPSVDDRRRFDAAIAVSGCSNCQKYFSNLYLSRNTKFTCLLNITD